MSSSPLQTEAERSRHGPRLRLLCSSPGSPLSRSLSLLGGHEWLEDLCLLRRPERGGGARPAWHSEQGVFVSVWGHRSCWLARLTVGVHRCDNTRTPQRVTLYVHPRLGREAVQTKLLCLRSRPPWSPSLGNGSCPTPPLGVCCCPMAEHYPASQASGDRTGPCDSVLGFRPDTIDAGVWSHRPVG